ncbi:hypothetical protein ER596_25660 [Salmonella enterica subsp. enterica serovar Havana]|uniref:Uncharacterized protein n=3 Tax=Salmonella enterica I TaxID=59201 RepID=A0A6X7WAK0_SALET|nr:hypothetical protein [Salmonella enterica]EBC9135488.1 hypothetical protein [Salmonella enterica subsp. enterica serovar Heidelberg]ECC2844412.1 hypothetical protein [Salmonella enterica subsp. enterica]ECT9042798.1 hypothetical protein [Salmonella enterica subsp. enterica serovar Monschaui]EDO2773475.1 hypothetical protein [Salmonella enterica subsp. enterica serovar Adelaide]EAA7460353.1 hypothetical protein [Salmonella enterica subsp. enterica serovar Havana]
MVGERLRGFWATVNQGMADNDTHLCLLLNTQSEIDIAGANSINGGRSGLICGAVSGSEKR